MRAALIYPHQLYPQHPAVAGVDLCVLVEEPLLFRQYNFHAQKLVLHRASLQHYQKRLKQQGLRVEYIESHQLSHSGEIAGILQRLGVTHVDLVDPCDDWLERRLTAALTTAGMTFTVLEDPNFLTPLDAFDVFAVNRAKWYFSDFYQDQRRRLGILLDDRGRPLGGQWSFDAENRRRLPKGTIVPEIEWPRPNREVREAVEWVRKCFPRAPGERDDFHYPVTSEQARAGLDGFLVARFAHFGEFEDAIHAEEAYLFHSVLTPALNIGLISPREVVDKALARMDDVPLNSLEGFLRQIIGWREYMRGVYRHFGRRQRVTNFWNHHRPMPRSFYDGTTGIEPVDTVIHRVLRTSYCHHIERLMVLGNFLLLCEIDPDAIYRWFMELFIDAYDWVMVPNVYGMSQHADGGLITTKPYLSGSSYVRKMSNFPKGDWCAIWDALYWRFIHLHRQFFAANPRMAVMVSQCDRLGSRLDQHLRIANDFIHRLA